MDGFIYMSRIYRNDGGAYVNIGAGLPDRFNGSACAWGDYDNDGDLDLALTGIDDLLGRVSKIYRNDKGAFVDIGAGLARGVLAAWMPSV
jgi:hypothetical protein